MVRPGPRSEACLDAPGSPRATVEDTRRRTNCKRGIDTKHSKELNPKFLRIKAIQSKLRLLAASGDGQFHLSRGQMAQAPSESKHRFMELLGVLSAALDQRL